MKHDVVLSRDGIILNPFLPEHVCPEYVTWLNDPLVRKGTEISPSLHTIENATDYILSTLSADNAMIWRVCLNDGAHVGNIRLSAINRHHRRASVALIVGRRDVWGRGIGSQSVSAVSDFAFQGLSLHKLYAGIYASNPASRRAFEKAGYALEATLRDHAVENGSFIDVHQMARFSPLRG